MTSFRATGWVAVARAMVLSALLVLGGSCIPEHDVLEPQDVWTYGGSEDDVAEDI
ncbi:MAG TPA: hypothetical protein HPP83_01455 [Candidatus Hydrogenedentes bacterium]|nr:hypothetical protein [Candidatus Hydrogenedentota bacterium]